MSTKNIISREEYQVKKLLEGLNKSKSAAETEKEEKEAPPEMNPHMPKYIQQAPWYLNQKEQSLAHQKAHGGKSTIGINEKYQRGVKQPAAYKYRKGACENCGALTHKVKDCVERPRKLGAKWTGKDIQGDEIIQTLEMDYAAKRDRWREFDPEMYNDVIQEYEQFEEARKQARHNQLEKANQPDEEAHIDDEFKESLFDSSGQVANTDPKIKTNIRNLRIREDIAKYLLNLDENSAYYDAKTHSMRENPIPHLNPNDQGFKGDNFSRLTGDTVKLLEQEKFVWDLVQKESAELNSVALPTATEMIFRKAKEKLTEQAEERKRRLAEKYGERKEGDPEYNIIFGQTEEYVEYLPDGKVKSLKNAKSRAGKSRYEEDIYPNDHTSVWGSWWNEELGWGFDCCHQTDRHGMCLGEKGKKLALVKEFKIKKAKQEQLSNFTKQVIGREESPEKELHDETANLTEKLQEESKPMQDVKLPKKEEKPIPVPVQTPDVVKTTQEMPVEKEINKAQDKAPQKAQANPAKQVKPRKRIESSDSSNSSATSSSEDSSSDSSDSDSSESSKSSKSSSGSKNKRGDRLKDKRDRKHEERNKRHGIEEKKLQKKVHREEEKVKDAHRSLNEKRKYNSVKGDNHDISQEEIEAYKQKLKRFDDPMHFA